MGLDKWMGTEMKIPKQIIIETSANCNLQCKGCPFTKTDKRGFMEVELFKSILKRIDFKTTVIPWMNGESLLHPKIYEMLALLETKKLPYYITTNATIWNDAIFSLITNKSSNCYQIIFSIDGLENSNSIEIARPGSDKKIVMKHINDFLKLKKNRNSKVDVAVKICERGQDYEEIENYIYFWLKKGVSYVCVGKMLDKINTISMRRYPCKYFDNKFMVIRYDGTLSLCAYNSEISNENKISLGNVGHTESLLGIYNNLIYSKLRISQNKGVFNEVCLKCGFAYTGQGFRGKLQFRDTKKMSKIIYYHNDYYNQFFSFVK